MVILTALNIFVFFQVITFVVNFSLLYYVIHEIFQAQSGKAYLPVAISLTFWSLFDIFTTLSPNLQTADFLQRVGIIPALFLVSSLLHFVLFVAYPRFLPGLLIRFVLIFLPTVILTLLLVATPLFDMRAVAVPWGYNVVNTSSYFFLSLYIGGTGCLAVMIGLASLTRLNDLRKKQMGFFLFAFIFPLLAGITTEVIAPAINVQVPPLTTPLSGLTGFIIIIAIKKYEFLSISPSVALEQVFNTIQEAVMAIDLKGKIVLANAEVSKLTGISVSELLGKSLSSILHESDGAHINTDTLFQKKWNNTRMVFASEKSDHIIPILLTGTELKSMRTVTGLVFVARDMTETDKLIHTLEQKTKELETHIEEVKKLNDLMIGRELAMSELKRKNNTLESQLHSQ